jgi:hypothetical protein
MTPLTNEEFATVQRFCQLMSEKIAAVGLDVFVESNFRDYIQLRRRMSPDYIHNPTYDPGHSGLSLLNAFWLRAVDSDGRTAAMIAERIFDSDDFFADFRTMRIWHDRPEEATGVVRIDSKPSVVLSGRIGHTGGLWIEPAFRKKNLSGLLDHLARGLLLKNFWFDHITAVITESLAATGIGNKQYGWGEPDGRLSFDFFAGGPLTTVGFYHASRADSLRRMERWLLMPECNTVEEVEEFGKLLVD